MIRRLIILLLIVGCEEENQEYSILGKWQVIESTNMIGSENQSCNIFFVGTYFEITVDNFIWVSEQIGMDENGNPTTNWFSATNLNYIDNNPNLILLYESEEFNQEFHFTYEVNNAELNLHQSLKIQWDGDSTNCNSNINTITVTDIPETSNP